MNLFTTAVTMLIIIGSLILAKMEMISLAEQLIMTILALIYQAIYLKRG